MARKVRDLLTEGKDPIQERQNLRAQRKKQQEEQEALMAPVSCHSNRSPWNGSKTVPKTVTGDTMARVKKTARILRKHVFPTFGKTDIETITPEGIRRNMKPI